MPSPEDKRVLAVMFEIRLEAMRAHDRVHTDTPYTESAYTSLEKELVESLEDKPQASGTKCPKCGSPMKSDPFDYICTQASCGETVSKWRPG